MRGTGTTTRRLYWVTDGQGRQFVAADSAGARFSSDDVGLWGYHRYAGGTQKGSTFGADRFASDNAAQVSFFRNRAYDQSTGRWLQEDPIGVAGGLNLYQFNGNNPVMFTDPFGLCAPFCLPLVAGAAAVATSPAGQRLAQQAAIGLGVVAVAAVATTGNVAEATAGVIIEGGTQIVNSVRSKVREIIAGLAELLTQEARPKFDSEKATDEKPGEHRGPPPDPSPVRKNPDGTETVHVNP